MGREVGVEDIDFRNILGKKMCLFFDLVIFFVGIFFKDVIKDVCEDLFIKMFIVYNSKRVEIFYK